MDEYIGTVKMFAGHFVPQGYTLCDGKSLSIKNHEGLFSIIGTGFGGDGISTFCVPNLNSKLERNQPPYVICINGVYPPRD